MHGSTDQGFIAIRCVANLHANDFFFVVTKPNERTIRPFLSQQLMPILKIVRACASLSSSKTGQFSIIKSGIKTFLKTKYFHNRSSCRFNNLKTNHLKFQYSWHRYKNYILLIPGSYLPSLLIMVSSIH